MAKLILQFPVRKIKSCCGSGCKGCKIYEAYRLKYGKRKGRKKLKKHRKKVKKFVKQEIGKPVVIQLNPIAAY